MRRTLPSPLPPPLQVIFVDADPSWITGQSYGISGPLCTRATSLVVSGMREANLGNHLSESFAAIVRQLGEFHCLARVVLCCTSLTMRLT